ncbi:conserved hypothetical protein [Ricinus communis]|uniref:Uncharacterized protein n=1 Tax=Ricinus communis TaxID=3988 RepID=B9SP35_RICCO|nr:conserved hypothetical protein [Ricinus communis]
MASMARKKKGAICEGSYITNLAHNLGIFHTFTNLIQKVRLVDIRVGQDILEEPTDDTPTMTNQDGSHHRAFSSSSSTPSIEATLQYHSKLLHWLYDGVSHLSKPSLEGTLTIIPNSALTSH